MYSSCIFQKTDSQRTHVIELYAYSDEYPKQITSEIIANTDAGIVLTEIYKQEERLIYAPDSVMWQKIIAESTTRKSTQKLLNLTEMNNLHNFLGKIKKGDSLILIAQGDLENGLVAGRDAASLAEILSEDLELKNKGLNELELHSCGIGQLNAFRKELILELETTTFKTLITYTLLCSVGKKENTPYRLWIKLAEEDKSNSVDSEMDDIAASAENVKDETSADIIYWEDEIDNMGIRLRDIVLEKQEHQCYLHD
jgi:hypothetical protein